MSLYLFNWLKENYHGITFLQETHLQRQNGLKEMATRMGMENLHFRTENLTQGE